MDKSIKRTEKEIDEVTQRGEQFVREHPRSMFGDDNVQSLEGFKEIIRLVKEGKPAFFIREHMKREQEQGEDEDSDERWHYENEIDNIVDWLEGQTDEAPY